MLRIAGQTAGQIGLKFFVDTHGWPGGCYRLNKIENIFSQFFINIKFQILFFPRATPGSQLVIDISLKRNGKFFV